MKGIEGTGLYGRLRTLSNAVKADTQQLNSGAPMTKKERKDLEEWIAQKKEEIKSIREQINQAKSAKQ